MTGLLAGKSVVITGAGRGIGAAAAHLFAREGARVVLASRTGAELESVAAAIRAAGGVALVQTTDVTSAADIEALFGYATQALGRIDGVFACAGIESETASILDLDEASYDRIIDANFKATWLTIRAAATVLPRGGAIVTTSSIASVITNTRTGVYAAAKSGLNRLTEIAARELGPRGVRVNVLAPGATRTQMIDEWEKRTPGITAHFAGVTPLGRLAEPEEIAEAAAWLLSDRAAFVTGAFLLVDGGITA